MSSIFHCLLFIPVHQPDLSTRFALPSTLFWSLFCTFELSTVLFVAVIYPALFISRLTTRYTSCCTLLCATPCSVFFWLTFSVCCSASATILLFQLFLLFFPKEGGDHKSVTNIFKMPAFVAREEHCRVRLRNLAHF